jgi:DNA mismatch repair ATPase MutS
MRQDIEEIKKILESIPEHFHILESKTDWDIHNDYIKLIEKFSSQEYNEKELINKSKKLFLDTTPSNIKIELLVKLGCFGTVKSYRILEKFYNNCDKELKTWSALALQKSYILLESHLTDSNSGFISTGLGGKDNCLRFFYVIFSTTCKPFNITEKKIINLEFEEICKKINSKIETIDFQEDYSCLMILIPMDVPPDTFIMNGINKCNELGEFIVPHYFVTNVDIPSKKEIIEIIDEMRKDIK